MKKIQILLLLFLGILLIGCGTTQPQIEYVEKIIYIKKDIPQEYLVCERVDVNTSKIKTQADIARVLIDLKSTNDICADNVQSIIIMNK